MLTLGIIIMLLVMLLQVYIYLASKRDDRKQEIALLMQKYREDNLPKKPFSPPPANKDTPKINKTGTYQIDYQNRKFEVTTRIITIKKIYRKNNINYIRAFCHLRDEYRTFKLDSIIGYITDIETGEMLDPALLNPLKKTIPPTQFNTNLIIH